jgi:hypothetical protein
MECFDSQGDLLVDENGNQDCDLAHVTVTVDDCLDAEGNSLMPGCDPNFVVDEVTTTTSTPLIESKVYTITVLKSITGRSCENVIVAGMFGGEVAVELPSVEDGTTSSAPISG